MSRGLSFQQPWASLVADGIKKVDTRTVQYKYRGPLYVCASKTETDEGLALHERMSKLLWGLPPYEELPFGCVVARTTLLDCIRIDEELTRKQTDLERICGRWIPGNWALILGPVEVPSEFIAVKGNLGLIKFSDQVEETLRGLQWEPI